MNDNGSQIAKKSLDVGIIGCGWLGSALAKSLLDNHHKIFATVTNDDSVAKLNLAGLSAQKLCLPASLQQLIVHPVFKMSQLVICIPPKLKQGKSDYSEKINQIVQAAELSQVKRIILISTTSIYNGLSGQVNEKSKLDFSAPKVKILYDAEQAVHNFSRSSNIIRFAGLIGPMRHPGQFLSGKKQLDNPNGIVNLIHQTDAIGIINSLLLRPIGTLAMINNDKGIYNGVCQTHLGREQFYLAAAKSVHLDPPTFITDSLGIINTSKQICGAKVTQKLKYAFVYNDLVNWMEHTKNV